MQTDPCAPVVATPDYTVAAAFWLSVIFVLGILELWAYRNRKKGAKSPSQLTQFLSRTRHLFRILATIGFCYLIIHLFW